MLWLPRPYATAGTHSWGYLQAGVGTTVDYSRTLDAPRFGSQAHPAPLTLLIPPLWRRAKP